MLHKKLFQVKFYKNFPRHLCSSS